MDPLQSNPRDKGHDESKVAPSFIKVVLYLLATLPTLENKL